MIRGLFTGPINRIAVQNVLISSTVKRGITASSPSWLKKMPDRPPLVNEEEFTESFLKGSGPGGQKIVGSGLTSGYQDSN